MDNTEILVAAMSDPEFKVRLQQLREEQAALKAQHDALLADIDRNAALVQEAREHKAMAEDLRAQVREAVAKLKEDTADLAKSNQALTDEKERWEKIRQTVDAEQTAKAAELEDREVKVEAREKIVEKREMDVIAEGEALADSQRKHQGAADHFARGLRALNAPAD